jgi:hypothetical protein
MADPAMPLQNRVTPEGEIIAVAARGLMMGNRGGPLHGADQALRRRRWVSKQWICCRLEFNGRRRQVMAPNRYTELFFLDEATALAAGHRPCFECRRQDFLWFASLWGTAMGKPGRATVGEMDTVLHQERVTARGEKVIYRGALDGLPSGAFVRLEGQPYLVLSSWLLPWSPVGYGAPILRPDSGDVEVLTPRSTVAVLSAGYCPTVLHESAEIG